MYARSRRWMYKLFAPEEGGRIGRITDWFIIVLIAANVTAVILETVNPIAIRFDTFFTWFEAFSVAVFTIEYAARVWAAVEQDEYKGSISGRFRFARRPLLIIDLLAILPFYLSVVGIGADLRVLRVLRLIRLLRLLKLARYSESIRSFEIVLSDKKPDLLIATFANGLLLILASSLMYYIENSAQPEEFSSIPQSMWWGVTTLTTVGYGDMYPVTPAGQFLGAMVAILGLGMFALPASILASGFIDAAGQRDRSPDHEYCPHCGERLD